MTERRTKEAIRYLGYGQHAVDKTTLAMIDSSFIELESCADKRSVYRIFEYNQEADVLNIGTMKIKSRNLERNLRGCKYAALFGATLGAQVDLLLRKHSVTDMARTVVLQACAAACLEEYCDECQEEIGRKAAGQGLWMRPRFSPGYGDFDIHYQGEILRMLDAPKKIGLTMTESCMLTPVKSVTALIGLSTEKTDCHRDGCEVCGKTDCIYRRNQRST